MLSLSLTFSVYTTGSSASQIIKDVREENWTVFFITYLLPFTVVNGSADDTTCLCLPSSSPFRVIAAAVVYHPRFEAAIVSAIIISAILLAAPDPPQGPFLEAVFSIETAVRALICTLWLAVDAARNCHTLPTYMYTTPTFLLLQMPYASDVSNSRNISAF